MIKTTEVTDEKTFFTNAPEAYDYSYVTTVRMLPDSYGTARCVWREITVSDALRFEHYQTPRYASGMYQVCAEETAIYRPPLVHDKQW